MNEPPAILPTPARRRRKLHAGHFAFMRAVVQGLDARASWERYLRIEGDADDGSGKNLGCHSRP